jgi:hypothetical protein
VNERRESLVTRYLVVAFFIEAGLILLLVPWSAFWERNYFAEALPTIQWLARSHTVRGAVSGLGVVNLCAGIADLISLLSIKRR